ncbi:MAG: zf-HC2 domain-containing protein [Pyrinomonadaceae bacterium]
MALQLYDKAVHGVRYWLLRRLPPCKVMAPLMSESLERRLTWRERVLLQLHLWVCVWCVWYLKHLQVISEAVGARAARIEDDPLTASLSLSNEARERIRAALERQKT